MSLIRRWFEFAHDSALKYGCSVLITAVPVMILVSWIPFPLERADAVAQLYLVFINDEPFQIEREARSHPHSVKSCWAILSSTSCS